MNHVDMTHFPQLLPALSEYEEQLKAVCGNKWTELENVVKANGLGPLTADQALAAAPAHDSLRTLEREMAESGVTMQGADDFTKFEKLWGEIHWHFPRPDSNLPGEVKGTGHGHWYQAKDDTGTDVYLWAPEGMENARSQPLSRWKNADESGYLAWTHQAPVSPVSAFREKIVREAMEILTQVGGGKVSAGEEEEIRKLADTYIQSTEPRRSE